MDLKDFLGEAGDLPAVQLPGRPLVRLDPIPQLHRHPRGGDPPDRGRRVQLIADEGGVETFPAAPVVSHPHHVGDQHMIMDLGVPGPGCRMPRRRPNQTPGPRGGGRLPPPPAYPGDHRIQIGHRGVAFRIADGVHVLGPADHPQLGDRLRRRHHQLQARPAGGPPAGRRCGAGGPRPARTPPDTPPGWLPRRRRGDEPRTRPTRGVSHPETRNRRGRPQHDHRRARRRSPRGRRPNRRPSSASKPSAPPDTTGAVTSQATLANVSCLFALYKPEDDGRKEVLSAAGSCAFGARISKPGSTPTVAVRAISTTVGPLESTTRRNSSGDGLPSESETPVRVSRDGTPPHPSTVEWVHPISLSPRGG